MEKTDVLKLRLGDNLIVKTRFGEGLIVGVRATEQLVGYPLSDEVFVFFEDKIRVDGQVKTNWYWLPADEVNLTRKLLTDEEKTELFNKSKFTANVVNASPDAPNQPKLKDKAQQVLFG